MIVHRHITEAFVSEELALLPFGPDIEVESSNEVPAPCNHEEPLPNGSGAPVQPSSEPG
jgi:hypothetical protein